ncbi:MAG: PD40 domain-containing protein [Armatimonadetes bacterium]|nr:PD40 domain-containing protein [Armatimonadota bacterium]
MPDSESPLEPRDSAAGGRLDSWKEIAAYLDREDRTVRRWEKTEGLPVHRHVHSKRATVYAFKAELDAWLKGRDELNDHGDTATAARRRRFAYVLAIAAAAALIAIAYLFSMGSAGFGSGKSVAGALINGASEGANHDPKYTILFGDVPQGPSVRQPSFDISPSGDRGVFYEVRDGAPGQLYLYEQSGSVVRPLLNDLGPWQGFRYPSWSPRGRLIAYVADRLAGSGTETAARERNRVAAIFVVSPDGGTPRQIGPTMREIHGLCWTPDGQGLSYLDSDRGGVHTVSLDGSGVKTMPLDTSMPVSFGGYSPDGRWLAIKVRTDTHLVGMHSEIRLLSTTGGQAVSLTTVPGLLVSLTWAPDGSSLYYSSDASGGRNIWKLSIDPKTGAPHGDPVQVTFFSGASALYPKFIGGGRRIAFLLTRMDRTIHVADASRPTESRSVASGREPKLSPDGQVLYFLKSDPGGPGIYAVPSDGGTPLRLAERIGRDFDLSPDGATLAYFRHIGSEAALFTVTTRGGEPRLLLEFEGSTEWAHWPRWSPDGSLLAYAHGTGLYVIPSGGGTPKKLAELPRWQEQSLRWSPDGEFIAAFGYPDGYEGNNNVVVVVPASGGEPRQLTSAGASKEGLEWHPDGQRLTYHVTMGYTRQVFLDGRPPSRLVNQPERWDHLGKWAPDGRRFFFLSYADDNSTVVYVFDESTGDISPFPSGESLPTWSRDGRTMAWVSMKFTRQIWIMSDFR